MLALFRGLFAPQLDLHNFIREIGKLLQVKHQHMHMLVLEFLLIAYRINVVFSILRRLDTLASTMTSTKCTFSHMDMWSH